MTRYAMNVYSEEAGAFTMKRIFSILFGFLLISQAFTIAQPNNSAQRKDGLYLRALTAYLQSAIKEYESIKSKRDYYRLIVQKTDDITDSLPTQIGNHKIFYKDEAELIKQSLKQREAIPVTVIRLLKNDGPTLIVAFSEYWVSYENKTLRYYLEGGCKVEMKFDSTRGDFVIEKVEFWGV